MIELGEKLGVEIGAICPAEHKDLARAAWELLSEGHVAPISTPTMAPIILELIGDVGAGKTTFTRGLAKGLGIESEITSPSFTISKSYAAKNGKVLTHYDFYRLSDPGLMSEDLQEKLSDHNQIIVIEWGESVADFLPSDHITVTINYNDDNTREVTIK